MLLDLRSIIKLLDKSSELCILLFRECRPGFLMEDYFHHDLELRVATIFGKVIVGAHNAERAQGNLRDYLALLYTAQRV